LFTSPGEAEFPLFFSRMTPLLTTLEPRPPVLAFFPLFLHSFISAPPPNDLRIFPLSSVSALRATGRKLAPRLSLHFFFHRYRSFYMQNYTPFLLRCFSLYEMARFIPALFSLRSNPPGSLELNAFFFPSRVAHVALCLFSLPPRTCLPCPAWGGLFSLRSCGFSPLLDRSPVKRRLSSPFYCRACCPLSLPDLRACLSPPFEGFRTLVFPNPFLFFSSGLPRAQPPQQQKSAY